MNQLKKLLIILGLLIVTACNLTSKKPLNETSSSSDTCTKEDIHKIDNHDGSRTEVESFWKGLNKRYEKNRKLVVFMDGTMNKRNTNTNVWRLYKQSLKHACSENPVIPYYITGLGTTFGNFALGSTLGLGSREKIISAYKFLAQTYKKGDEIFIFGFSRGSFTARSLNGVLEYGGLLKPNSLDKVERLYEVYNQRHDGTPSFLKNLKSKLSENFGSLHTQKVEVSAIGVFDTVPAIGYKFIDPRKLSSGRLLYSDPDDHRTDLYAKKGFHAMSLDEQRTAFELLRFPEAKGLEEVWFSGGHENIGGHQVEEESEESEKGLSKITFDWMISKFKEYQIFPDDSQASVCGKNEPNCEGGKLWDSFFAKNQEILWNKGGVLRRRPKGTDFIHESVFCRLEVEDLGYDRREPNDESPEREPNRIYKTFYIEKEDRSNSNIVAYQCHKTNN